MAKGVTTKIEIFEDALDRPCGAPHIIVVLVLKVTCAGNVCFNSKSSTDLHVCICMKDELSSEDWHLELLSAEVVKCKAARRIMMDCCELAKHHQSNEASMQQQRETTS